MKGAILAVLCAIALTQGALVVNQNGCPVDYTIPQLLPHPNCGQFYQCVHGMLIEMFCAPGLHFSTATSACDFPLAAKCQNTINLPDSSVNVNANTETEKIEDVPIGDNNDDPSQAAAICATQDSDGVLVAHENCRRFYKCDRGAPVEQRCPGTLLFDPTKDRCEWPDTVDCGNRVIGEIEDDVNEGTEWTSNGAGNDDPSQAPAICAAAGSDNSYVAHEICNKFYQCWAGHPVALDCPAGYLFNPDKDYCDFPSNVDCGDRVISENPVVSTSSTIKPEDDIPVGDNHDDPSQAAAICATQDSDGVLVAHENCRRFYKCDHGAPVEQRCPGTLLFDPTKDRCEWPDTVDCGNRVIGEIEDDVNEGTEWTGNGAGNDDPSQAPAICAAAGSDNSYVAHEICNKFYQCWAGHPVALDCPAGYLFNPDKDYCDFPSNVDCGDRIISENPVVSTSSTLKPEDNIPVGDNHDDPSQAATICAAEESDGILVAHENCRRFYKCDHGAPVEQRCPSTLLFDPTKDRCEWPDTVDCGNRVIGEIEEDVNEGTEWTGNGAGNDDPSQAPAICAAEGSDNSYVAHEICNKFYQCWAGHPVALDCPTGYLFNPNKDYCDFPNNVDCGDRIIV